MPDALQQEQTCSLTASGTVRTKTKTKFDPEFWS
jgi:hypothetical protein